MTSEGMDVSSGEDFLGPSDEEEGVTLTPREVLERIQVGWMNEKVGPELLPPLEQEKDAMMEQLKLMDRNLNGLDKKDMRTEIHKLEMERIKYVVVSYMRTRLFKIQKMAWFLYDQELTRPRHVPSVLMAEELLFLKNFVARTEEYMKTSVLSKFPVPLQKLEPKKLLKSPHMDAFVFLRVLEDHSVDVEDAEDETHTCELKTGEQHMMRYKPIAELVRGNAVTLV